MIKIVLLLFSTAHLLYSQHNWINNRNWVIGEYIGFQVDSTSSANIKVPFNFSIKYSEWSKYPELGNDTTIAIDPKNLHFKIRNDSLMVLECCSEFWLNYWGKMHKDSTIEFLYIEPFMTGGHRVYTWGKRVKSYVSNEDNDDFAIFKIWPNPTTDYLFLSKMDNIRFISIFNSQGYKVISNPIITNQGIDISILPLGIYMIQLCSEGKFVTKQFYKIDSK